MAKKGQNDVGWWHTDLHPVIHSCEVYGVLFILHPCNLFWLLEISRRYIEEYIQESGWREEEWNYSVPSAELHLQKRKRRRNFPSFPLLTPWSPTLCSCSSTQNIYLGRMENSSGRKVLGRGGGINNSYRNPYWTLNCTPLLTHHMTGLTWCYHL